jgi:DNA polymerase-3 subunit beta
MDFSVAKTDLVRELNLSQGVVERKTTIPILSNVLLEADGETLVLTATDLELAIRCEAAAKVKASGSGTVPAKRLLDYVRLLPEGEVQLKFGDNAWASITSGRSRTRMAGMSRESFPELPQMPDTMVRLPVGLLAGLISRTIFSISAEDSRFTLNGALLQFKGSSVAMVTTDGHRLALAEYDNPLAEGDVAVKVLLPRKAMNELLKLAGEAADKDTAVEFAADDNHLFFRLGQRLLSSRKLSGNFPDYERVLPKTHVYEVVLERDELRASIERVAQFADERSGAIKLRLEKGALTISSSSAETGESEDSIETTYQPDPIVIGFNSQYLLDFLKASTGGEVRFECKDSQSAGQLRPDENGDAQFKYRYVVMPMRI